MKKVHSTIRGYARYAVGAFVNFGLAEIEGMNLEFNLKVAGYKDDRPTVDSSSRSRQPQHLVWLNHVLCKGTCIILKNLSEPFRL